MWVKGQEVNVVGLGRLGHFTVLWTSALVISHSPHNKNDALELGAKHFVSSGEEGWAKPLAFKFRLPAQHGGHDERLRDY